MNQQTEQQSTTDEVQAEPEVTLDDVYAQYGVEPSAQTEQPDIPQTKLPDQVPDPFDPAFKDYLKETNEALHKSLQDVVGKLSKQEQEAQHKKLEEDINSAVTKLNDGLSLKPMVVQSYLDAKARTDMRFKSIWDNRGKNPEALNAALGAIKKEMESDFQMKVDPSLKASERALKLSQQQMATTKQSNAEDNYQEFESGAGGFDRAWELILNGQYSE